MHIHVNGEPYEHRGDGTLDALLAEIGADVRRVAVMVDGDVVRAEKRASCRLVEGCSVEVLTLAGGG